MLLSYVNTQLRDFYRSLDAFCEDRGLNRKELEDKLDMIDYAYDPAVNQICIRKSGTERSTRFE